MLDRNPSSEGDDLGQSFFRPDTDNESAEEDPSHSILDRVLPEEQLGLEGLTPQRRHNLTIIVRNNSLLERLLPQLRDMLEQRFDLLVNVESFPQGTPRPIIQDTIGERLEQYRGSTVLTDDTCYSAWGISWAEREERGIQALPHSLDRIVNSVIEDYLRGDCREEWKRINVLTPPRILETDYMALYSGGNALTNLLRVVKEQQGTFETVYFSPRHLFDHSPLREFYLRVLTTYEQVVSSCSDPSISAERSQLVGAAKEIFFDFGDHAFGSERRRRAHFPEESLAELQRVVGDPYGIAIRQPYEYVRDWIEASGIAKNVVMLDTSVVAPWNGHGMVLSDGELFIADRHYGAIPPGETSFAPSTLSRELDWIKSHPNFSRGKVVLLPLSNALETLRAQALVRRSALVEEDILVEQVVEKIAEQVDKLNRENGSPN